MIASDYDVTFPYGATDAPYSASHPHRGDDRPCPEGTPVVINGVTIGLTGHTGMAIGPHLHIQEWTGNYANTRKPQNAFKPGTVTNIDPSGTQGDGSFGKFIDIKNADGWTDSYCHLSEINVTVGQVIGGDMLTPGQQDKLIKAMKQAEPTAQELSNPDWANDPGLAIDALWDNYGKNHYPPKPQGYKPYTPPPLYVKE